MKKILILNPCLYTNGGGEKYMGYFCRFLESYYVDVRIDILVYDYNNMKVMSDSYVTIEDLNEKFSLDLKKTFVKKMATSFSNKRIETFVVNRQVEQVSRLYDLFFNWNFLSKQQGKSKFNIYFCMFPPKKYLYGDCKLITRWLKRYIDKRFERRYDYYLCISKFTSYWLRHIWPQIPANKSDIIYPPVYSCKDSAPGKREKKNIIISVGRFFVSGHNKKQKEMLQCFLQNESNLENCEYHLVGSVSDNSEDQQYLKEIQELSFSSTKVFFHINCEIEELKHLYSVSKIFWHATGVDIDERLYPEKMEHFGITTVEAMSYGVVPVVVNKGGQREIVEHGRSGFLWNNFSECIERTRDLLKNNDLYDCMSNCAIETSKQFSIEQFEVRCKEVFDSLKL